MYIPPKYRQTQIDEVESFLEKNGFGILVSQGSQRPLATHIPMVLQKDESGQSWLLGHVAKANPHWQDFKERPEVLAIFNGPHAYISSSWYHDEEVPTWNYIAVHVHGHLELLEEQDLLASLHTLVNKHEAGSKSPVRMEDLSPATMRQIRGIVGFRIRVSEIHAATKLSQGREIDHPRIIQELEDRAGAGDHAVADAMKDLSKKGSK